MARAAARSLRSGCVVYLLTQGPSNVRHLASIRSVVGRLAEEARLRDPTSFAHSWHILMKGSIVAAAEGDAEAAKRARSMAGLLLEQHR